MLHGGLVQQNAKEARTVTRTVQKWQRPAQKFLKINCDASFRRETGDGGWGFIIRDEDGDMVSAGRVDFPTFWTPSKLK